MLNFIVVKICLLGKYGFQKFPQLGDVPLVVSQVINKLSYGVFGSYLKEFIEGTAGRNNP